MNELERNIFFNTGYQIIGKILTSLLGFISLSLIARSLGILLFGQYSLIFVYLSLSGIFADFGLVTLLIREIASKRGSKKYLKGIFSLRLLLNLLIFLVAGVFTYFLPFQQTFKLSLILGFASNVILSLSSVFLGVFQAGLRFKLVASSQIITNLIILIFVFWGYWQGKDLLYFIMATLLGNLFGFLFILKKGYFSPFKLFILDKKLFFRIIKDAWPIGLGAIVTTFYLKIDSIVLSFFYNPSFNQDLGIYSSAYKIFEVIGVFIGFFQTTTFPVIASKLNKKNFYLIYQKLIRDSLLIGLLATGCLFLMSEMLINIFSRDFVVATSSLKILSLALSTRVVSGIWLSVGVAGGKQKELFFVSIAAFIFNLLLNLLIIPRYSFIGASWVTVFTQGFITLANLWVASMVIK
ncbi:MAG: Polysaccharide biosynthesis protein [Microgenomates group bacterium ADurb.Bin219]|nr:MAG: Polysaccharide biosynthesis protein [Microgenomates group bacterium ADurb.Bin219]